MDSILEEVVDRLVQAYNPERIFLFGSHARGDQNADSDYDLMIVVPDDASAEKRQSRLAYQVLRGTGIAVDALVWRHSDYYDRLPLYASLPAAIQKEGRELYVA